MAIAHPLITRLEEVGTSEEGRTIRAIVISNNPADIEEEPRIRLTGAIHGSEIISAEILIKYIDYLTDNYDTDSDIKALVDSRYIVIIPVLNPDGFVAGTRYNANRVDLNRNFSYAWSDSSSSYGGSAFSESESSAMRDYSEANVFHTSVTYHSGAVIVNRPFDYASENAGGDIPDENDLVVDFAKAYSTSDLSGDGYVFKDNPDMLSSALVDEGTINGGDWYVVTGSLQDWSYKETGCLDFTVEVAKSNPDTEAGINEVFLYNRDSMTAYIEKSGYGIHGRVTDSVSGEGIADVEISVDGGDIFTTTDLEGYYHRIILPGDYDISYDKSGYSPQTISVTFLGGSDGIVQNVDLTSP